jgi:Ser/Thr protein kinase RdoA (MazF antagonist)
MDRPLPVVHSTLAAGPLVAALWPDYALPAPTGCHLLNSGFNDHYFVTTPEGDYVLRVYHHGWRTAEEVEFELTALAHLQSRGVPVCGPIARRDGAYQSAVAALEGPRLAALFPFATGRVPAAASAEENRACARVMAQIHQHSDDFESAHARSVLDLHDLIDAPLAQLLPFLGHRPDDAAFMQSVATKLHAGLESQLPALEWGFCHGDFHGGNARLDADGTLRVFDFDCCGLSWRAYDLAVCRLWCAGEEEWDTFCAAYREVRPLPETTLAAIPWFIVARQFWWIGLHVTAWQQKGGDSFLDDRFLDHVLGVVREREERWLPEGAKGGAEE